MTEFEFASLHASAQQALAVSTFNYFSIVSAALVGAYLVADQLDRLLTIVVLSTFTLICLGLGNETVQLTRNLVSLGIEIQRSAAQPGSALTYHVVTKGGMPEWMPVAAAAFNLGLYLATVLFFFRVRWSSRDAA